MIDTSILIAMERRSMTARGRLRQMLPLDSRLSAVALAELLVGIEAASDDGRRMARSQFLADVLERCVVLPFAAVEAEVYARLYVDLRTRGALIGERDLQIAATAIAGDHDLLTHDLADFGRVPGLRVRTLPRN